MSSNQYSFQLSIVLIGLPGCGKTTAASFLSDLGFSSVSAGDTVRELYKKEHKLDKKAIVSRELCSEFGSSLLAEKGFEYFADLLLERGNGASKVVFEGIRPIEVVQIICKKVPRTAIIYIDAPEQVRIKRLSVSKGETEDEYNKIIKVKMESEIESLKDSSDFIICNNDTLREYHFQLRNAVSKLNK